MKTKTDNKLTLAGYDPYESAGDCHYNEVVADGVVEFFENELQLIEGKCAGKPFHLEPWQECIVRNLFGWMRPDGTRRYRESFIFVPRKNGKTPFCAGIINYVAFCDGEPGAQIYSAAGEREQAALVFRHAAGMIRRNPTLASQSRVYRTFKSIEYGGGATVYKALSADADTKHGLNSHLNVIDELHVQPNRDLVDTLETATASRTQPLTIHITTAGFDKSTICYEKYDYAKKVRDGIINNPYFFPVIYEADEADDWTSEEIWRKANPNLGVSVELAYIRQACEEAQQIPAKENTFKRLHLNIWTEQDVRWISSGKWSDLAGDINTSVPCFAGLDMSTTTDLTAFVLAFQHGGSFHIKPYFFAPKENAIHREKKDGVPYLTWAREGHIELTEGNVVDYDHVRRRINEIGKLYNICGIAADRWNSTQLINQLTGDGFDVVPFGQGFASMSAPSKKLEELILKGTIVHDDNPVMNWCISNVTVKTDAAENIKPVKDNQIKRIDGVVGMVMALGLWIAEEYKKASIYESRGAIMI